MKLTICWIAGFTITVVIYALAGYLNAPLVALLAGTIAAIDAKYARIWRVDSALPDKPSDLFIWMIFFGGWLLMPWYLATRFQMMMGIARMKRLSRFPYRFHGHLDR